MHSSVNVEPHDEVIRKIEDIIDIQKAKGNFNVRQVVFHLPSASESGSAASTNLAKSLESDLLEVKSGNLKKSYKNLKSSRHRSPPPDVISWPSDSDITVLRMKLCLTSNDLKENVRSVVIPGDGLHQPDSSSMVNLATLIIQSQHPSKHSIVEEFLLPLTSWEHDQNQESDNKEYLVEKQLAEAYSKVGCNELKRPEILCNHRDVTDDLSSRNSGIFSNKGNTKAKVARFLRLYFCPCCTCLYKLERMRQEPSVCFTKRKDSTNL